MIRRALKIFGVVVAVLLVLTGISIIVYTETRPERRILVEENYTPPKRPQAAQPTPQPADDLMTPMLGDE